MKEGQISARQLDYGDTRLGLRAGISSGAGSCSAMQSCEVVEIDVQHGKSGSERGIR